MDLHHVNHRANLDAVKWDTDRQAKSHPFRVRVTPTTVYNHETGEVVATAAPGYEFYYAHNHAHLAPIGYDTEAAIKAVEEVTTQVAQPMNGGMGVVFSALAGSTTLPLLTKLTNGVEPKE